MKRLFIIMLMPFLSMVFCVGCGPARPEGMPNLVPVVLTFTQEGEPLADAEVQLWPDEATTEFASGGMTGADGTITLQTHGRYPGVPQGRYTITVRKITILRTGPWDQIPNDETGAEATKFVAAHRSELKEQEVQTVDAKFLKPETSDLKIQVERGRVRESFELGPAVQLGHM